MDIPKENRSVISPTFIALVVSAFLGVGVFSSFFSLKQQVPDQFAGFDVVAFLFSLCSTVLSILRFKKDKFGGYLLIANIIVLLIIFGFAAGYFFFLSLSSLQG